jgi:hypothetical protein
MRLNERKAIWKRAHHFDERLVVGACVFLVARVEAFLL